jgi:transcriptional regulator with XRE-family HTH domain
LVEIRGPLHTSVLWCVACYKQSMSLSQPSFGELIKRARRAAGLTQEALATRAGLSARVISDLERQVQHTPRPATVRLLVEALPISASERAFLIELATEATDGVEQSALTLTPGVPTLVDRVTERAAIEALLTTGPATLCIEGEAGIGKTRMLDEAARIGTQHGWHVLRASAATSIIHAAQDPVVAALRRDIEARSAVELRHNLSGCHSLVHVLPELIELGSLTPPGVSPAADLLARDASRYLRTVAGPNGTLMLLDDLHCAPAQQLEVLTQLIEMAGPARIAIIGTYRPSYGGQQPHLHTLLGRLASRQMVRHMVLPPLSTAAAAELFSSRRVPSARDYEPGYQADCLRDCGGVPLDLVSVAQEREADVPWIVRESVLERVRMLPHADVVLQSIVVAGDQATLSLIVAMTGGTSLPVLEILEAACRERLLVEDGTVYRFAYPLIRRMMAQGLPYARRELLSQRMNASEQRSLQLERSSADKHGERTRHLEVLRAHRRRPTTET